MLISLSSCTQVANWLGMGSKDSTSTTTTTSSGNYAARLEVRDESITAENAYSDLFLDTAAVEQYIQNENMSADEAKQFRGFYNFRNYQYAWFASDGMTEQGQTIWALYLDRDSANRKQKTSAQVSEHMDTIIQKDSLFIDAKDSSFVQTELALTRLLMKQANENKNGMINSNNFYFIVPAKKLDPMVMADSILHKQDSNMYASNKGYMALRSHLAKYYTLARSETQDTSTTAIVSGGKKGKTTQNVSAVKRKLNLLGYYAANDTTSVSNDSLKNAIKDYQSRNGLKADGTLNDSTMRSLNVPAKQRVEQILVNMNRLLWSRATTDSNYIQVNIPSYMLYTFEGNKKVFEMPVVVGKQGTNTVMFNGDLSTIVFNPYWNIPESIVKNEIMPAMKKDKSYLKKKNMEIVSMGRDSIPVIRQLPGKDNSLGTMKFIFPNSFDIYLHDTPDKGLFRQNNRAQSHGCIRVADAPKLATYLLEDQKDWTEEKIKATAGTGKEQTVNLQKKNPVMITYYTVWVDETGKLRFANDVYNHDQNTIARMFTGKQNMQNVARAKSDSLQKGDTSKKVVRP